MSKVIKLAAALGLSVTASEVETMNPIIFKAKVVDNLPGITVVDGKNYRVNTTTNEATEVTADGLKTDAVTAIKKGKDKDGAIQLAEDFGLIKSVTFAVGSDVDTSGSASIVDTAKALGLKIINVEVATQHEVIFKSRGLAAISGLTKDDDKYFLVDSKKNTASLVNPEAVSEQAVKDLLKGKVTDFTRLAESFCLVTALVLAKPTVPTAADEAQ